jgi:uncharacterized protein YecT (DUF1311 family)
MKKIILTFFILTSCATITFSQTQLELNIQSSTDYKQADNELNKVYKQVMNAINPSEKQALIASQKAWITYRDLECKFQSIGYTGGSMYPMVYASCMTDMTKKRTLELKATLNTER